MKPYRELSRRARLRRLRKLAEAALVAYGLDDAHLSFIQYAENCIYRVDTPALADPPDHASPERCRDVGADRGGVTPVGPRAENWICDLFRRRVPSVLVATYRWPGGGVAQAN